MSLAVLARKTKTKQRLKSTTCGNGRSRNGQQGRSVGFVLNMTGRGGGEGLVYRACHTNSVVQVVHTNNQNSYTKQILCWLVVGLI